MSVDFFGISCKESSKTDKLFGICDDQNGKKAYTNTADRRKWIATVINDSNIEITFTAIDNCIIVLKEGTKNKESTCDGMLTFTNSLYLIELKEKGPGGWLPNAQDQLENTIRLLYSNHSLAQFRHRKAYACNRKHPNFTVLEAEKRKDFFNRTNGFRIDAQAEIIIK